MLRVLIVEDSDFIRKFLYSVLQKDPELELIGDASGAVEAREKIIELGPDLVFLDIELSGSENGFDLLASLPCEQRCFDVIFASAYVKYALDAARAGAVDFIIKPYGPADVMLAVAKVKQRKAVLQECYFRSNARAVRDNLPERSRINRILLPVARGFHVVESDDILYCHSEHNHTSFYILNGQKLMVHRPIASYEEFLRSNDFFEVGRSYWVNLGKVRAYSAPGEKDDGGSVILSNGARVAVSRRKKRLFLDTMEFLVSNPGK